jgi:hypothetical protein
LIALNSSILEWAKGALPHEITHLLVAESVFGLFGDIPVWLNEGLAEYVEGQMTQTYQDILNDAATNKKLISIRSLASGFSTDSTQAYLSYAESHSIVSYLIEKYGWDKMRRLLDIFREGSTYDKALLAVYGFDTNGLDKEWRLNKGFN